MVRFRDMCRLQVVSGEPITVGETTITPQARVLAVRWPGGGWVWNRPHAVLVERRGRVERVPIVDVTRVARWAMLGVTVGLWLLLVTRRSRRERKDDDVGTG
jgi:hypothetical protein